VTLSRPSAIDNTTRASVESCNKNESSPLPNITVTISISANVTPATSGFGSPVLLEHDNSSALPLPSIWSSTAQIIIGINTGIGVAVPASVVVAPVGLEVHIEDDDAPNVMVLENTYGTDVMQTSDEFVGYTATYTIALTQPLDNITVVNVNAIALATPQYPNEPLPQAQVSVSPSFIR
jgi:hypothetical protein